MNTGERLVFLSGLSGVSAATHLLAIGLGATTGQALVDYSQLASATAEVHLLAEQSAVKPTGGWGGVEPISREKWERLAQEALAEKEVIADKAVIAKVLDDVIPRLNVPTTSLADLLDDARLLQLEQARALENALMVRDALVMAKVAYLTDLAVQQEKDAIAAFLFFME